MNLLRKLPGHRPSPPGLEWTLWRRLPALLLWGTLLPGALWLALHFGADPDASAATHRSLLMAEYLLLGVLALHWTLLLTVALGCLIVMAMKGPAYMADASPADIEAQRAAEAAAAAAAAAGPGPR